MSISEDVVFIFSGAGGFHFLTFRIYLPFVSGVESQEGWALRPSSKIYDQKN